MKIAVIKNAGSFQANMVLQGVYGTLQRSEQAANPDVPQNGQFAVASEFNRVSHLFGLLQGGRAPVDVNSVAEVDVPEPLGTIFKANLMNQLGMRWEGLYESVTPSGIDTLTKAMLQGEQARVQQGVRDHLASMGMRVYSVTAKVDAQSAYRSTEYGSLRELAHSMNRLPDAVATITDVVDVGTELLGRCAVRSNAAEQAQQTGEAAGQVEDLQTVTRPWFFEGHHAAGELYMTFPVVASSAEQAVALSQYLLNDNSVREIALSQPLTMTDLHVENVRQGEAIQYGDVDGGEDEDGNYDRPHTAY